MKLLAVLCSLFSASTLFASSPAATQQWVKNYVASNVTQVIGTDAFQPVSWTSLDENGNEVTVTMTFSVATNEAFQVFDSTVPGLTNGTLFAKAGKCQYVNYQHESCNVITGAVAKLYTWYGEGYISVNTNSIPYVTNTVYTVTNDIYGVKYGFCVGDELFDGTETLCSYVSCVASTGGVHSLSLRTVKITDAERDALTTLPTVAARWSLFDLIFPSCSAITYGTKIYTGDPVYWKTKGGVDLYTRPYKQVAYTDSSDACNINLGTITIGSTKYDLTGIELLRIDAGELVSTVKNRVVKSEDELKDAVKEKVGATRWKLHFTKSSAFTEALSAAIKECNEIIAALKKVVDPYEDYDVTSSDHDCKRDKKLSGVCGKWNCDICGKSWTSMGDDYKSTHSWNEEVAPCHACGNPNCYYVDPAESGHGGWHNKEDRDGDQWCVCKCENIKSIHKRGEVVEYKYGPDAFFADFNSPTICVQVEKCGRCGLQIDQQSEYGGTWYATVHMLTSSATFTQDFDEEGNPVCVASQVCNHGDGLGCNHSFTEQGSHVKADASVASDCKEIETNDVNHAQIVPCENGFNSSTEKGISSWKSINVGWCGYTFTNEVAHNYNYNETPLYGDPMFISDPAVHYVVEACANADGTTDTTHCGHIKQSGSAGHSFVTTNVVFKNASKHTIQQKCSVCLYPKNENEDHLVHYTYGNPTATTHDVSNYCSKCETEYYVDVSNHVNSGETKIAWISPYFHEVSNKCELCNAWYLDRADKHLTIPVWTPVAYTPYGKYLHIFSNLCVSAEMGGCGKPYYGGVTNCVFDRNWKLVDNVNAQDSVSCVCGNVNSVNHFWEGISDAQHWCTNGVGHLKCYHNFIGDVCVDCNWNRSIHGPDTNDFVVVVTTNHVKTVCQSCIAEAETFQCYATKMFEVRTFGSSSTSTFIGYSDKHCGWLNPNCGWEWDVMNDKCGCPMCQMGIAGLCMCRDLIVADGPIDGPIDSESDVAY